MRKCYKCNEIKEFSEFYKDKTETGGISYICKKCKSEASKKRRLENPEKYREQNRRSAIKNYDKIKASQTRYREKNREERLAKRRERRALRKVEMNARESERRKNHRKMNTVLAQKEREKTKEYYKKNREKMIPQRNAHKLIMYALKLGMINKPDGCEICASAIRVEGHHEDYTKPLEVKWLCKVCHVERHRVMNMVTQEN